MTESADCVFCSLMSTGDATWIAQEAAVVALFPLAKDRLASGHTLVVPRTHVNGVLDAPASVLQTTMALVQRVSVAMTRALGATGVVVLNASGPYSGQSVPHLHFHVVPRWADDRSDMWPSEKSTRPPLPHAAVALATDLREST